MKEGSHAVVVTEFGSRAKIVFRGGKEAAEKEMARLQNEPMRRETTSYYVVDKDFAKKQGYPDATETREPIPPQTPKSPKKKGRKPSVESDWNEKERKLREDGALTLGQYVKEQGGIDPRTLENDAAREEYAGKGGRIGKAMFSKTTGQPIDTLVDSFIRDKIIQPPPPDTHGPQHLLDLLEQHHTIDPGKQTKEAQGQAEHAASQQAEALDAKRARIASFNKPPVEGRRLTEEQANRILEMADWKPNADADPEFKTLIKKVDSEHGIDAAELHALLSRLSNNADADFGAVEGEAHEPAGATAGPKEEVAPGVMFHHEPIERAGISQEDWPPAINPIIGGQDPPSTPLRQLVEQFKDKGLKTLRAVRDYFGELSHEMAPRTTRMDRIAGEKLSQLNAADNYVREAIPSYIDRILGPDATPEDDMRAGGVYVEKRLRKIREFVQGEVDRLAGEIAQHTESLKRLKDALANDPQVKALKAGEAIRERIAKTEKAISDLEKEHKGRVKEASEVKTTIHILNPAGLRSEADFEEAKNDPKIEAILQRRREILVPELDKNYRMAQGTPDDEDIHSPTQIKGDEGNLKAIRPGETISPSMMFTSPNRGKLTNTRISRFGFARKATGSAQGYDLSLSAMIEHSFRHGYKRAMKAEAIRDMVSKGLAVWDHEKAFHPGHEEFPNVRPPQGTQENERNQTSLFVKEPANDEFRRAIAVDKPMRLEEVRQVMNLLTKGALASTVEAAYHTKNIMTMWTKPGMHPLDFIQNAYGVIKGHTEIQRQITELARIGALKEGGFESSGFWGSKKNPFTWAQRWLTISDKAMRLTMDDAFDRLSKQGRVENTETNRRNFINQLGQYNRKAQNHIVAWLRDTGLGPFATAGTRYYMEGMRGLTFEPGAKASSTGHAVGLRAEVMGRTLGILAATAVANYLFWGRVDGDDATPFGALKIGDTPDDPNKPGLPKTSYVDLTNLTGMTRGLRQTGALGVIEGSRSDKTKGQIVDKSTDQIVHSLIHPAAGPPVQSAYTGFTGKNISGYQIARKAEPGESQHVENLKSAAWNVNPVVGSLSGHNRPAAQAEKATTMERLMDLLGPYGIHYRQVKSKGLR